MQDLERSNVKPDKSFFQRQFKVYLKQLLKERDLERNDYLQHQLRNIAKVIKKFKENERCH